MNSNEFYRYVYRLFDNVTPLVVDCGQLCDAACCKGDDETGMYLFPYEKHMFSPADKGISVETSDFEYDGQFVDILICKPFCSRTLRPLACRIFPLFPYVKDEKLSIILDPRGKGMCPLIHAMQIRDLNPEFVKRVTYFGTLCMKIPALRRYLDELSRLIDDTCLL